MQRTNSVIALTTTDFEPKEWLILTTLKRVGPLARQSVATLTGIEINCVTGRVWTLIEKGVIVECGSVINPKTRKPNALLRLVPKTVSFRRVA